MCQLVGYVIKILNTRSYQASSQKTSKPLTGQSVHRMEELNLHKVDNKLFQNLKESAHFPAFIMFFSCHTYILQGL